MIVVSLEGPDFSGKSTLATALLLKLREKGLKVERTELPSRLITGMFTSLLRNSKDKVSNQVFALIQAADHLHHYQTSKYKDSSDVLILERSALSYYVYQGYVLGADINWMKELNKFNKMKPDITIIPKTPYEELLKRKGIRIGSEDKFEKAEFIKKVCKVYYDLPKDLKSEFKVQYFEQPDFEKLVSEIIDKILDLLQK